MNCHSVISLVTQILKQAQACVTKALFSLGCWHETKTIATISLVRRLTLAPKLQKFCLTSFPVHSKTRACLYKENLAAYWFFGKCYVFCFRLSCVDSVVQAINAGAKRPWSRGSLASHTLCRERKGLVTLQLQGHVLLFTCKPLPGWGNWNIGLKPTPSSLWLTCSTSLQWAVCNYHLRLYQLLVVANNNSMQYTVYQC